ncbi:MAG: hypothetical protein H0W96_03135, partial [Solirubrobacterales bacterium]|nr:hypothetical protein [Solirubrobacterales bacterium]
MSADDGSFLVEALVSAAILIVAALGVMEALDRGQRLGGQQKLQAVAGNVAQAEQERIRGLSVSDQSNLHSVSTKTVGAVAYAIESKATWVDDDSGDESCTTAGSTADYMKLSTKVSWPQMETRKPVRLESLIAPGVKSFSEDQGSLAVHVSDRNGDPVSGLQLNLTGSETHSDPTNDAGCVLWGYLPAGSGYAVGFSREPDYVLTDGTRIANVPAAVIGGQTSNLALQYDRGGYINTRFVTKRTADGALIPTDPRVAHVTHGAVSSSFNVNAAGGTSNLLFPFTSAYTVHADSCAAAEVPVPPPPPDPEFPGAPSAVAAIVNPGATTTTSAVQLPALNIKVKSVPALGAGAFVANAIIRVTTPCGTVIRRTTTSSGAIDDPGFPYASSLKICVSDGIRQKTVTKANNNFNVTSVTY